MIFFHRLTVPDLTPNIGLFWYFFTEAFEHFRVFFLCVFQINAFIYVLPLSVRFRLALECSGLHSCTPPPLPTMQWPAIVPYLHTALPDGSVQVLPLCGGPDPPPGPPPPLVPHLHEWVTVCHTHCDLWPLQVYVYMYVTWLLQVSMWMC